MTDTMIAQIGLKVKTWQDLSQYEKWLRDPQQAGREDAARARARYGRVGGQRNYTLLVNVNLYLRTAEHFMDEGRLLLSRYYLDLAKEGIAMLEARCKHD
jgi:hypothetical protein